MGAIVDKHGMESFSDKQGRPQQVRGPMQDLRAGPVWAVVLLRHRVQSIVLWPFQWIFLAKYLYENQKRRQIIGVDLCVC